VHRYFFSATEGPISRRHAARSLTLFDHSFYLDMLGIRQRHNTRQTSAFTQFQPRLRQIHCKSTPCEIDNFTDHDSVRVLRRTVIPPRRSSSNTIQHSIEPLPYLRIPLPRTQLRIMSNFREPTAEDVLTLFAEIENKFPHNTLGDDKWYLVAVRGPEFFVEQLN
jgi:hypothetical protein